LLEGELPTETQLADFRAQLADAASVAPALLRMLGEIPPETPAMDALRTSVSALAHFDPDCGDSRHEANLRKARRLLAQVPVVIAARQRLKHGENPLDPRDDLSLAGNLYWMITGEEPDDLAERAVDLSLVLYAEHEYNASTFAARVVSSTLADLHSAVTAAVGALKGPLHGGANERVMEVLREVGSPEKAEKWVHDALASKRRIMGFGHRVYKAGDPRAVILKEYCRQLAPRSDRPELEELAEVIERVVGEEKKLPPNLDWPSARLYYYLGFEVELYTPLFVASRVAGLSAHVIEQHDNNRLIRPRARYTGEKGRKFTPLAERG
jgi:citrate synthase